MVEQQFCSRIMHVEEQGHITPSMMQNSLVD